jgi:signal transduction histidine kinase
MLSMESAIGLAICKKIIERHGGKIWIEPAAAQGSRFCFSLPTAGPK